MNYELSDFLPYLLNQAAELVSKDFQPHYKQRYGMLRTEWRVLFHLGRYGEMTAKQICDQAVIHKTKVSRAVTALEQKRFVQRQTVEQDRRFETLSLTRAGRSAFENIAQSAASYDAELESMIGQEDFATIKRLLNDLILDKTRA